MIWEWLQSPDAQRDRYAWASAFGGHIAVGLALWLALLWPVWFLSLPLPVDPFLLASLVVSVAYLALWEGVQAAIFKAGLWDCLLDATGVSFGALVPAFISRHQFIEAAGCGIAAAIVAAAGVYKRRHSA